MRGYITLYMALYEELSIITITLQSDIATTAHIPSIATGSEDPDPGQHTCSRRCESSFPELMIQPEKMQSIIRE